MNIYLENNFIHKELLFALCFRYEILFALSIVLWLIGVRIFVQILEPKNTGVWIYCITLGWILGLATLITTLWNVLHDNLIIPTHKYIINRLTE